MSAHTPGPWRIGGEAPHGSVYINSANWFGLGTAVVRMASSDEDCAVGTANARLIVAAPDLLAALQALLPDAEANHSGGPDTAARLAQARAAIAKAAQS